MRNTIIFAIVVATFICSIGIATAVQTNSVNPKIVAQKSKPVVKQTTGINQDKAAKAKAAEKAALLKKQQQEAAKQAAIKKIRELQNQRREISLQIYKLRVKLIKEDPDMQALQKSVMDMHKKMAMELDSKPQIKKLLADAQKIDDQITNLIKQVEKGK